MKPERQIRKALLVGSTWVRVNHVNPKAAAPVAVKVVKVTPKEAVFDNSSYLTWPDLLGLTPMATDNGGWQIVGPKGVILTYTPINSDAAKVVETLLWA